MFKKIYILLNKAAFICTVKNACLIQDWGLKNGQKILFYSFINCKLNCALLVQRLLECYKMFSVK